MFLLYRSNLERKKLRIRLNSKYFPCHCSCWVYQKEVGIVFGMLVPYSNIRLYVGSLYGQYSTQQGRESKYFACLLYPVEEIAVHFVF